MQRINTPDSKFHNGDPFNAVKGTVVTAEWLNAVQEEVAAVIEAAGLSLDSGQSTQLLAALENLMAARARDYALDTGSVGNAYVIALSPAITGYANGLSLRFRTSRPNGGAATLDAGGGAVPLLREDGVALKAGDIPRDAITVATYVEAAGAFLINEIVMSQLGTLASKNIGLGLEDDGAGGLRIKLDGSTLVRGPNGLKTKGDTAALNIGLGLEDDGAGALRIKLLDDSLQRTAAGLRAGSPVAYFSGARPVGSADNMVNLVSTAAGTLNVVKASTLWNGFSFSVDAQIGDVTVVPHADDKIDNGTTGAAYLVPEGTSASFNGDGAGNFAVMYQTAIPGSSPGPQYISTSRSIPSGQFTVDSSAGALSLTLPASPAKGTPVRIIDAFNTFARYPVTLVHGAGDKIEDSTENLRLDIAGVDLLFVFKNGNWSIQ